jgi:hypothetical protein
MHARDRHKPALCPLLDGAKVIEVFHRTDRILPKNEQRMRVSLLVLVVC